MTGFGANDGDVCCVWDKTCFIIWEQQQQMSFKSTEKYDWNQCLTRGWMALNLMAQGLQPGAFTGSSRKTNVPNKLVISRHEWIIPIIYWAQMLHLSVQGSLMLYHNSFGSHFCTSDGSSFPELSPLFSTRYTNIASDLPLGADGSTHVTACEFSHIYLEV